MPKRVLILDTPEKDLHKLGETFAAAIGEGCEVHHVGDSKELLLKLSSGLPYDLVLVDYNLGDGELRGLDILPELRLVDEEIPIVAVADKGDVNVAAKAVKAGATDFLVRGKKLEERVKTLLGKMKNLISLIHRNRLLDEQNVLLREADRARHEIVGESPQIQKVIELSHRVAKIPRPVLLVGERGTGKEIIARLIHACGGPNRPLVCVNCAAFTDTLLESELFGHEKGSFTGADSLVHGKFELAKGGTLFLDEIGNMTLSFQQKILRVVEYGTFTRVGGSTETKTDARIIAATNRDLKKKMETGKFLRDLYDRLSFEVIRVPPLREREGDIEVLARYFLNQFMKEIPAFRGKRLSKEALKFLREYDFPGNVRELKNKIERAAYRDTTNEITPEDIGMLPKKEISVEGKDFETRVENFKKRLIKDALEAAGGNQAQAARSLGLSYHQFRYFHKKLKA
ncbi:MAG: sigma-54-dependent Fis family transcriptional regulator [Planctomycetota bacterium]|nr:MAG: sigma-54-dependent Fis family transcriptional regulator [Planctomycetota bacterium]